jgi:predicted ATPase
MQLLAAEGNHPAALALYRDLRLLLHRELCAVPDPETQALYEAIRAEARSKATAVRECDVRPAHRASHVARHGSRSETAIHNLPHPVNRFVGREREIAEVRHLIGKTRLLTVVGAGGVGKTRFALEVGREIAAMRGAQEPRHALVEDGIWLVELAPLADPAFVPQALARALGVREEPGTPLLETLVAWLRERCALLVLDNCEHLLDACAELAEALLLGSAGTRILATSREPLKIAGELLYRLPSLSTPDPACLPGTPEALAEFESFRLFVDRARAALPSFRVTTQNAAVVSGICARLDGIALAIELAAAWAKMLPVEVIQERLGDRFGFLTGGSRRALPRHQTLRGTLDWSYALLSDAERALLCRLSVFSGAASLEAIEAICECDLDLLTRLVDKSLVVAEAQEGEARYRLLETIRQYGAEKLEASGEATTFRTRHRDWYTELAWGAPSLPTVSGRGRWLNRLEREHDNLRGALEWAMAAGDAAAGYRITEGMAPLWSVRGHRLEGIQRLLRLLALPGAAEPGVARCRALALLGEVNWHHQDLAAMRRAYTEMLEVAGAIGDIACRAAALCHLGEAIVSDGGNIETARLLMTESVTLFRQTEDRRGLAVALERLGHTFLAGHTFLEEDLDAAQPLLEESLALCDLVGGEDRILTLEGLGIYFHFRGEFARARSLFEETLATSQELGFSLGIWW